MKIKYSALVSDMRGKLNGSVASKNRYGQYLRNKITPVNPQSSHQVEQRSKLATFSSMWKGLTEAQRAAWIAAVPGWTRTNIFGDITTPSGNILFNRINMTLATVGTTVLTLPPSPLGAESPTSVTASAAAGTPALDVTVGPAAAPTNHKYVIEATGQMSAGIYNANNRFRILAVDPVLAAGVADLKDAYVARFGTLVEGQKIFIRVSLYRTDTGEKSQFQKTSVIVGA